MRALDDAVRAGKVLYLGVSDTPAWVVSRANMLAECRAWTPFVALQVPYSLVNREIERELLPMAEALGMSVAAWSPLAGGILSGKYTHGGAPSEPQRLNADALSERDRKIARAVQSVAAELGASAAQVAIAWTMAKSPAVHPILGARRCEQLLENLGALELVLPAEALVQLDAVTRFDVGFPLDFIAKNSAWVFGAAAQSQARGWRA
jgi:aryl-alcohol dehydrogenase-like predicted oxidoreductase